MKDLLLDYVSKYRRTDKAIIRYFGHIGDSENGAFEIPSPIDRASMRVVASSDGTWEHVSVSRKNRCPNWIEMDYVKRLFFNADEVVVQYHVAESDHINVHDYCLHLWRNTKEPFPLPPKEYV